MKETGESMTRVESLVPLMRHDPGRCWITDPDPDHPEGMHPKELTFVVLKFNLVLLQ